MFYEYKSEKSAFFSVMGKQIGIRDAAVCCISVPSNVNTGVVEKLRNDILMFR